MRVLDGEQFLIRIFVGESARWHDAAASRGAGAAAPGGFAGATVLHGIAGFGARSVIHTAHLLDLSTDLPVVIEVVAAAAHVDRLTEILDEMLEGGLVTMEKVRVLRYAPGKRGPADR